MHRWSHKVHRKTQTGRIISDKRRMKQGTYCSACVLPLRSSPSAHETRRHTFLQLVFSVTWPEPMSWHLFPAPVTRGQFFRLPPLNTEEFWDKKRLFDEKTGRAWQQVQIGALARETREYVLKQFWVSRSVPWHHVKDEFNLTCLIHTKAKFSNAIAVMDRIGG